MSQNIGTLVSAAVRPNDSVDLIASAFANEIKGGNHGYPTLAERDAIIVERREWGMLCTVYSGGTDNGMYYLNYNEVDTDLTNNNNWIPLSGESTVNIYTSGGTVSGATIIYDTNTTVSAYTVDLTPIGESGSLIVPLIYNDVLDRPNTSIIPSFGDSTIDSGSTNSSILGGEENIIGSGVTHSSITNGFRNEITDANNSSIGGKENTIIGYNNSGYVETINTVISKDNGAKLKIVHGLGLEVTIDDVTFTYGANIDVPLKDINSYIPQITLNDFGAGDLNSFSINTDNSGEVDIILVNFKVNLNLEVVGATVGGLGNVLSGSPLSTIVSGSNNKLNKTTSSFIGSGDGNIINSQLSSILNGGNNLIDEGGNFSTILGGENNDITNGNKSEVVDMGGEKIKNDGLPYDIIVNHSLVTENINISNVSITITGTTALISDIGTLDSRYSLTNFTVNGDSQVIIEFTGDGTGNDAIIDSITITIKGTSEYSAILNGRRNEVLFSDYSIIGGNNGEISNSDYGFIIGRNNDAVDSNHAFMRGSNQYIGDSPYGVMLGNSNYMGASRLSIMLGQTGSLYNNEGSFMGGQSNVIRGTDTFKNDPTNQYGGLIKSTSQATIINGFDCIISSSTHSFIGAGVRHEMVKSQYGFIGGGGGAGGYNPNTYAPYGGHRLLEASGSAIIGGGYSDDYANKYNPSHTISNSMNAFIGGGFQNIISGETIPTNGFLRSDSASIVGGKKNIINQSRYSIIGGGRNNEMADSRHSFIGAGEDISINGSNSAAIIGGIRHKIINSGYAFIGAGYGGYYGNQIIDSYYGVIVGGGTWGYYSTDSGNTMINSAMSFIGGGGSEYRTGNLITDSKYSSIVGGGGYYSSGHIISNAPYSSIVGGGGYLANSNNEIIDSEGSFIGGGKGNEIISASTFSTIIGGENNNIDGLVNTHIIGSNITAVSANTTHVESLNIGTVTTANTVTDILVRDIDGTVRVRQATSISGGTSPLTTKYGLTTGFTADVTRTIVHNFGLTGDEIYDIAVKLRDITANEEIGSTIDNFTANSVDVTLSQTLTSVRVVIIG